MWTETGAIQTKMSNDTGEGTILVCRIEVPQYTDHLSIWFLNTGKSGAQYWDSNFGKNYIFRFVVEDLENEHVEIVHDPNGPLSWFNVEVTASPDVSDLAVLYRIMNDPAASQEDKRLPLTPEGPPDGAGKRKWKGSAPVPEKAVVRFTFAYNAYGNPHTDTNSGKGYLTWRGAERDTQAGVL
jgi:hypothetical protein